MRAVILSAAPLLIKMLSTAIVVVPSLEILGFLLPALNAAAAALPQDRCV